MDKPPEEQPCKLTECSNEHYWTAGNWKKVRKNNNIHCLSSKTVSSKN